MKFITSLHCLKTVSVRTVTVSRTTKLSLHHMEDLSLAAVNPDCSPGRKAVKWVYVTVKFTANNKLTTPSPL